MAALGPTYCYGYYLLQATCNAKLHLNRSLISKRTSNIILGTYPSVLKSQTSRSQELHPQLAKMAIMWDRDKGTRMHGELMTKWQNTTISTGTLSKDPPPFFAPGTAEMG
jgi:hypothetical protein